MSKLPPLERVLLILESVAQAGGELSVSDICEQTGLPAATVYRQVRELCDLGLLEADAKRLFSIGGRLKRITSAQRADQNVREIATPLLADLANQHGAAFFLSRARGNGVEIIHVEIPQDGRVSYLHPGLGFRPLHACSCAKAVAAFSSHKPLRNALSGQLRAYTEHTRTHVDDIETEFDQIRKLGYAECVQEIELGMCSVAAPVFEAQQQTVLSIGATGSLRLFTEDYRRKMGLRLIEQARVLADSLSPGSHSPTAMEIGNR